jgi:hypothetical protein
MPSVYTISQLLALRPIEKSDSIPLSDQGKTYLALWRRYHQMLTSEPRRMAPDSQIVYRFELGTPNKLFRKRYIARYGTTAGLKDLPRYPLRIFSVRVKFLEEHFRSIERMRTLLMKVFNRLPRLRLRAEYLPPPVTSSGFRLRKTFGQKPVAAKITRSGRETFLNVLGGKSYTLGTEGAFSPSWYTRPPPVKDWSKYWYFYRKRGRWRVSEHHPYGDEDLYLE